MEPYHRDGWNTTHDSIDIDNRTDHGVVVAREVFAESVSGQKSVRQATTLSQAEAIRLGLIGGVALDELTETQRAWIDAETGGELRVQQ